MIAVFVVPQQPESNS